jgi:hypothetical protein
MRFHNLGKHWQNLTEAFYGTATSESIMVQMIADLFFLHERGLWMGLYL